MIKKYSTGICKMQMLSFLLLMSLAGYLEGKHFLPNISKGNLPFTTDFNCFRGNADKNKVEIYYVIKLKDLQFISLNDTLQASFSTQLIITDSSNQEIVSQNMTRSTYASSTAEIMQETKVVIDQLNQYLPFGKYQIQLRISDLNAKTSGSCDFPLEVNPFDSNALSMSDIQLASIIKVDTSTNKFVKNNRYVFPNPERQFIHSQSNLYFYFEIYNLVLQDSGFANTFALNYSISNVKSQAVIDHPAMNIPKPGQSCVKVQAIDIRHLECGDYQLHVKIKDNFSNQAVSASKRFIVSQPESPTSVLPMSEEDIRKYRDQIKYFATQDELNLFDQLTPKGRESFLLEFWRSKDTDPATPENEFMQNCFSRIHYANTHFKGKENGLNSDMGRVFVIYGQPDDIENYTMEMHQKPYVIWHYFTTGSGKHEFIFVDQNNTGIYSLVHSTVEGEIKNEQWKERELK